MLITTSTDRFALYYETHDNKATLKSTGIAWSTDKKVKFDNPSGRTLQEGDFKTKNKKKIHY